AVPGERIAFVCRLMLDTSSPLAKAGGSPGPYRTVITSCGSNSNASSKRHFIKRVAYLLFDAPRAGFGPAPLGFPSTPIVNACLPVTSFISSGGVFQISLTALAAIQRLTNLRRTCLRDGSGAPGIAPEAFSF